MPRSRIPDLARRANLLTSLSGRRRPRFRYRAEVERESLQPAGRGSQLNQDPDPRSLEIHLIAIGGTGMAPLACLLEELGHRVRGSDAPLYPPMSTLLEEAGIEPRRGYEPSHLQPPPDLVVVGNAVPRDNPEAAEARRLGLEQLSMPQALARFFLAGRDPLVVAGTHGKTTTTALAAWVWSECGTDPGFLVGGVPRNFARSFRRGGGSRFIVEGDEYNAAYFDRGPKFLHYRPETAILTSVEYDHADLYPDPAALLAAYARLVELIPAGGRLVACGDSAEVREIAARAACRVELYGMGSGNDVRPVGEIESGPEGTRLTVDHRGRGRFALRLPMTGEHNVANALAVWAAALGDGLDPERVAAALGRFGGVKRRMEELGTAGGVVVIDDFAHHPTAAAATAAALRRRYPERRLVAVYEPRTLTAGRSFLFDAYLRAFAEVDRLFLAPVFHAGRLGPEERLDTAELARRLAERGIETTVTATGDELLAAILGATRPGDVLVTMSSGAFDSLPHRLFAALRSRSPTPS